MRKRATLTFLLLDARYNGISSFLVRMSTLILRSSKSFATLRCPQSDAVWNGVQPLSSREDMAAPHPIKNRAISSFAFPNAKSKAVFCLLFRLSTFVPLSISNSAMLRSPVADTMCSPVQPTASCAFTSAPWSTSTHVSPTNPVRDA
jgi:hypothetical protein